ncbi:MAG: N-acetyl sugar amidotransferase [Bacteroidota bacterium]
MDLNQRPFRQCAISVMDTIADPDITFDEKGICNYYHEFKAAVKAHVFEGEAGEKKLAETVKTIKKRAGGSQYDCILGLSGGADSSYMAVLAKQLGLNPLVVHFDYGWNTELAVNNIEQLVTKLDYDLYTYVMDWEEFKDLQRSYFKASVLDLDVPADHMIFGALYKTASKYNVKTVLSGNNVMTEHTLPKSWNYNKFDMVNLKNIHKTYSKRPLKKLPALGVWDQAWYQLVKDIQRVNILDYIPYNKEAIKGILMTDYGWRDYGGKHYESVFTRFYQGYILPKKWQIDKRKAHLSNLIFAGQLTKEEAEAEMVKPCYDPKLQQEDFHYVAKKLGFTDEEFEQVLTQPNRAHEEFGTDKGQRQFYFKIMRTIKPISRIVKKFRTQV